MPELLFDTPACVVMFDPDMRCLHVAWNGRHHHGHTLVNCGLLLRLVRQTGATCVLNDSTLSLDGWYEFIDWLTLNFFPRLAENGIRAVAWVNPRHWPTRAMTDRLLRAVAHPVVDTFADVEAAHAWLANLPASRPEHPVA